MTNRENYKQAFGTLHASMVVIEEANMKQHSIVSLRRAVLIGLCAALLLGIGITAYAYGGEIKRVMGWGGNATIELGTGENGEVLSSTTLHTDSLTEPVEICEGRMYFIVNNEHIEISDSVENCGFFKYEYIDEQGNTHLWLIGLNSEELENYGYAEFIRAESGEWLGGYSVRINIDKDGTGAQWFENAKEALNIPW